jgi:hypothetical protein
MPGSIRPHVLVAGLALVMLSATAALAQDAQGPITIQVTTSLDVQGKKGFKRFLSEIDRGDVSDSARDVERVLGRYRWARLVPSSPEMLVVIESRERNEQDRWEGKDGDTIDHVYAIEATIEIGDDSVPVRTEEGYRQGPRNARSDSTHFGKAAEKLVGQIAGLITQRLEALRPDAPDAGFGHEAKFKLLIKGDGLEVTWVTPGSPAERAGLQLKDRIRKIDLEKGTIEMDERTRSWWLERPGTRVMLEVERNKVRRPVELTLLPRSQWAARDAETEP